MKKPNNWRELQAGLLSTIQSHWKAFLWQGILLMLLGVFAMLAPTYSTLAAEILFGWLMFAGGALRLPIAIHSRHTPGAWLHIVSSGLLLSLGLLLILQPLEGMLTLTQVLVFYLAWHAIASFIFSFRLQPLTRSWLGIALSAVIDAVLIGIIIIGWPTTAHWVLGVILGCNLFFFGLALVYVSLNNRNT